MKSLLLTLVAALSLSAQVFATSPTFEPAPKTMKVCVTVHGGYEIICFEVTVESFQGSLDELDLTGKIDARANRLNLTGFPREFNTQIFITHADTRLRPAERAGKRIC